MNPRATKGVIKVGEGRGFIIQYRRELPPFKGKRLFLDDRLVVTAAHCLPRLPPCYATSFWVERTYPRLLGPLRGAKPSVWAECLFVNPVADIALLGSPDSQELGDECDSYNALTEGAPPFAIGKAGQALEVEQHAWVLTLDGKWRQCITKDLGGPILLRDASGIIKGGMSGSPILRQDGAAIGVVSTTALCDGKPSNSFAGNPSLEHDLPVWAWRGSTKFRAQKWSESRKRRGN
jgi:hypothetical protein